MSAWSNPEAQWRKEGAAEGAKEETQEETGGGGCRGGHSELGWFRASDIVGDVVVAQVGSPRPHCLAVGITPAGKNNLK